MILSPDMATEPRVGRTKKLPAAQSKKHLHFVLLHKLRAIQCMLAIFEGQSWTNWLYALHYEGLLAKVALRSKTNRRGWSGICAGAVCGTCSCSICGCTQRKSIGDLGSLLTELELVEGGGKAFSPMWVTESGMVKFTKELHS